MGKRASTNLTKFDKQTSALVYPRYKFDYEAETIYDTKFKRNIVASCKRGGEPQFRIVDKDDEANHASVADIFGEEAAEVDFETDFDPVDFADRYHFDLTTTPASITCKPRKGAKAGAQMKLYSPNGWDHWFLRNNEGRRVYVTPAELAQSFDRDIWEVEPPKGSKTILPLFPDYAFTPDGLVWRIRSREVLLSPAPVPLDEVPCPGTKPEKADEESIYRIHSPTGRKKYYRFTRASIKEVFQTEPR